MNIVHVSHTPVAGQPLIIVNALNRYTNHRARLVTYDLAAYGARRFDCDINWQEDREVAMQVLESADIIHLHQYWDLVDNEFGIDFTCYKKRGAKLIRQYHSVPLLLGNGDAEYAKKIVASDVPLLILSHHQERFYPRARVVPLMVPVLDQRYRPSQDLLRHDSKSVLFAPTTFISALGSRWDTKGAPETLALLNECVAQVSGASVKFLHGQPHQQLLKERRSSYLTVDDMVTGTYHTASLESLSMGVPVFAHLDSRVADNVRMISGSLEPLPWVDYSVHEARGALNELLRDEALRDELGQYSRNWMLKYWHDQTLIQFYVDAYDDLVNNPDAFNSNRIARDDKLSLWFSKISPQLRWETQNILSHWGRLERECKGQLILCGQGEFNRWFLELLTKHNYRLPERTVDCADLLSAEEKPLQDKNGLIHLDRLDYVVLAEGQPSLLNLARACLEAKKFPARLIELVPCNESYEALVGLDEISTTPLWRDAEWSS